MKEPLPDFIIIGAMKCGTTSLHYYLRNHPEIFMPQEKELDFFIKERNYKNGESWYRSRFDSSFRINGEASPNYTKKHIFPEVPERIHNMIPKAKFIFLYRNPAERTWSHYIHNLAIGRETQSPRDVITPTSNYVQSSMYYKQLEPYLSMFEPSQLLLMNADSLRNNRREALKEVFDFLGVKFFYDEKTFGKDRHKTKIKTQRSNLNNNIINTRLGEYLKTMLPEGVKVWYKKLTESPLEAPEFSPELRMLIQEYVKKDQLKFKELLTNKRIVTF